MFGKKYNRSNQQLVAHCFFTHGQVHYENYEGYYKNEIPFTDEEAQHIIDMIEADADY